MSKVLREPWTRNLGFITRSVLSQERIQNWGGGSSLLRIAVSFTLARWGSV